MPAITTVPTDTAVAFNPTEISLVPISESLIFDVFTLMPVLAGKPVLLLHLADGKWDAEATSTLEWDGQRPPPP